MFVSPLVQSYYKTLIHVQFDDQFSFAPVVKHEIKETNYVEMEEAKEDLGNIVKPLVWIV
jgi:hypothetical protein